MVDDKDIRSAIINKVGFPPRIKELTPLGQALIDSLWLSALVYIAEHREEIKLRADIKELKRRREGLERERAKREYLDGLKAIKKSLEGEIAELEVKNKELSPPGKNHIS